MSGDDGWTPDERTVREVQRRMSDAGISSLTLPWSITDDMLPKPDPATALVEEWKQSELANEGGPSDPYDWGDLGNFTRWLINTGRIVG